MAKTKRKQKKGGNGRRGRFIADTLEKAWKRVCEGKMSMEDYDNLRDMGREEAEHGED